MLLFSKKGKKFPDYAFNDFQSNMSMQKVFFEKKGAVIKCTACRHYCIIPEGKFGICGVRKNVSGKIELITYSRPSGIHLDPIEKKPLYHYLPGSKTMSIGFFGCNFKCEFCQNYSISTSKGEMLEKNIRGFSEVNPKDFIKTAEDSGAGSIAFTYNEPTISIEYALDTFDLLDKEKKKLGRVFVSNGYSSEETIKALKGRLDAVNIDLKSFSDEFYKKIVGGKLENVLKAIKSYYKAGIWVELTTLVIPNENDSKEELEELAGFIASVDKKIPLHIIGFFPMYKMAGHEPAGREQVERAVEAGKNAGLKYVYSRLPGGENTYCSKCGEPVIKRSFYGTVEVLLKNGRCECGEKISGIF